MGPEKIYENQIKDFLRSEGAYFVKYFANRNTRSGIPDILACINGYFVGVEVKAEHGSFTPLQEYNLIMIREAGGFGFVLYPSGFEEFKKFVKDLKNEEFSKDLPLIMN